MIRAQVGIFKHLIEFYVSIELVCVSGEEAARRIIEEGLKVGLNHKDSQIRDDFVKNSNECELFVNKLSQSQLNGTNSVEALAIGKQLQDRLYLLGQKITHTLVQQYADDFVDVNYPLKKLHEAATSPKGKKELIYLKTFMCVVYFFFIRKQKKSYYRCTKS